MHSHFTSFCKTLAKVIKYYVNDFDRNEINKNYIIILNKQKFIIVSQCNVSFKVTKQTKTETKNRYIIYYKLKHFHFFQISFTLFGEKYIKREEVNDLFNKPQAKSKYYRTVYSD